MYAILNCCGKLQTGSPDYARGNDNNGALPMCGTLSPLLLDNEIDSVLDR